MYFFIPRFLGPCGGACLDTFSNQSSVEGVLKVRPDDTLRVGAHLSNCVAPLKRNWLLLPRVWFQDKDCFPITSTHSRYSQIEWTPSLNSETFSVTFIGSSWSIKSLSKVWKLVGIRSSLSHHGTLLRFFPTIYLPETVIDP